MFLSETTNVEWIYQYIFPAVLAAVVALLGIVVQLIVGIKSNMLVLKSIRETQMIDSRIKFYRPFSFYINGITFFFQCHDDFEFCEDKYNDSEYQMELVELKNIYLKICEWYEKNCFNMYPENKDLDDMILEIYSHMNSILNINITSPKSWRILKEYKKIDIEQLVYNIKSEINELSYGNKNKRIY